MLVGDGGDDDDDANDDDINDEATFNVVVYSAKVMLNNYASYIIIKSITLLFINETNWGIERANSEYRATAIAFEHSRSHSNNSQNKKKTTTKNCIDTTSDIHEEHDRQA